MQHKMMSPFFACTILVVLAGSYWTAPSFGRQRSTPAPPNQQDTIWVTSVPAGLRVYLAPDVETVTEKKEEGWAPIVEKHAVIDKRNLKGVTPLTLRAAPGKYLLAIAPVVLFGTKDQGNQIDPTVAPRVLVSFDSLNLLIGPTGRPIEKVLSGAAVYPVEKLPGVPRKLVFLAVSGDLTLDALETIYPKESSFAFEESAVARKLTDMKIPEGDVSRVLSLLHRGGKVVLVRGDTRWKIVVSEDGTPNIGMEIRPIR
jgi:hypothetical protein